MNQFEQALGSKSRSGEQWDIWNAVFSPVCPDGYPCDIWDKETGAINRTIAQYWLENYDLRYIMERDWVSQGLGMRLRGKLRIYVGDMDSFYLDGAVLLLRDFLESTTQPYYSGKVVIGDRFPHCWSGDEKNPVPISRLTNNQRYAPEMAEHMVRRFIALAPLPR
jgi:hypothetical protein